MALPADLLLRDADEAARLVALSFLDEARAAAARLHEDDDAEALHDFRVAVRRLRSTVRAYEKQLATAVPKKRARALKAIQTETSGARDAEVIAAWLAAEREHLDAAGREAADRLVDLFRDQRGATDDAGATERARDAFTKLEPRLRRRLALVPLDHGAMAPPSLGVVAAGLARLHAAQLASSIEVIAGPDDAERAHAARIAGKRLRYLLEPLRERVPAASELVRRLKGLQDVLGELHDLHVALDRVAAASKTGGASPPEASGFAAIAAHADAAIDERYADFARAWSGDALERFVRDVEELARDLERTVQSGHEIERKYLLRAMPPQAREGAAVEIAQGYVPGEQLHERLRRIDGDGRTRHVRTVKLGDGVRRIEIEEETSREIFEAMWPLTEGHRLVKRRWRVADSGLTWEIDEFLDRDLVLAEVELPSPEIRPALPSWLEPLVVREVTDDPEYVNLRLAR